MKGKRHIGTRTAVLLVVCHAAIGCGCGHSASNVEAPTLFGRSELRADADPPRKARLVLAGTPIPIEVHAEHDGTKLTLSLKKNGELFEEEAYLSLNDSFQFLEGGGESYDPPIPLITYPGREGQKSSWDGDVEGIKANAEIIAKRIRYYFESSPRDALEVRVNLTIVESPEKSSSRELMFIIVPEKGVIQRSFGTASVREPIGEDK